MTTVRPGWARTGSVGPHLREAWDKYYDTKDEDVIGITTLGELVKADKPVSEAEKAIYRPMMDKWYVFAQPSWSMGTRWLTYNRYKLTTLAADGIAQPANAVAMAVHDAMTDRFLQAYYTVGYDALLGQMVRDLTPENIYEYTVGKTFKLF
jgi:hypothetical protein